MTRKVFVYFYVFYLCLSKNIKHKNIHIPFVYNSIILLFKYVRFFEDQSP